MNTFDRVAPMIAGLLVVALILTGLIYAAYQFTAAVGGLS